MTSSADDHPRTSQLDLVRRLFLALGPVAVWAVQPFTAGALIGEALDPARPGFRGVVSWMAWLAWLAVLVALALPRPLTLTLGRIGSAAIFPAAVWAALEVESTGLIVVGLVSAASAVAVPLLPAVGERFVDGASYGDERRFPLRPPGPVLLFLVVPTWSLTVVGASLGPILLADQRWVLGGMASVVGVPAVLVGYRALSRLTSRFLVFVPNGLVIHDIGVLAQPVLLKKHLIASIGLAPAGAVGEDFTSQALGLALEMRFREPMTLPVVESRGEIAEQSVNSLMVSPSRPATVLRVAANRGFPIG